MFTSGTIYIKKITRRQESIAYTNNTQYINIYLVSMYNSYTIDKKCSFYDKHLFHEITNARCKFNYLEIF